MSDLNVTHTEDERCEDCGLRVPLFDHRQSLCKLCYDMRRREEQAESSSDFTITERRDEWL